MDASANENIPAVQLFSQKHEAIISLVTRQTDYSRVTAIQKLQEYDGNYLNVIRNYMKPEPKSVDSTTSKTTNQRIMTEIRHFMDSVNKGYEERKTIGAKAQAIRNYREIMRRRQQQSAEQRNIDGEKSHH